MAAPNFMVNAGTTESDAFYKVATTPEGGYATFGKAGSYAVVSKYNEYGYMEWAKSFEGVVHSNCNSGAAGDDGLFLTGRISSSVMWVAKISFWGEVIWQKEYTHSGYSSPNLMGNAVVPTSDGGCAISVRANVDGSSGSYYYDLGLAKIANDGSLEWIKFYGTANYDYAGIIIEAKDTSGNSDGYLIVTQEDGWGGVDLDNEIVVVKVDAGGTKQWVKAYAGYDTSDPAVATGNEFVKGVCQTADYGYVFAGQSYSASDPSWSSRRTPFILKVDNAGNKVWAKRFGSLSTDPGSNAFTYGDVTQAADNSDLILAGSSYEDTFWLLRFSAGGDLLNEQTYPASGSSNYDQLGSVAPTLDGGAVAAKWSKTYGAGDYDGFLMKFDADLGFSGTSCDAGSDPGSEVDDMTFEAQDVTDNCHEIDYTSQWTVETSTAIAFDPGFWLWHCAADADDDKDGIENYLDNCPLTANSGQEDGDGDGYGNACDCDLDNSGSVDRTDYTQFRRVWGTADEVADFNSDGSVGRDDFTIIRNRWGTSYPWY
jgi:hypothetical protein